MKLNEKCDDIGDAVTDAAEPARYSEAWWASLTTEELHEFVARGFNGGDVFYAAVAESNRREWAILENARQIAAAEAEEREKAKRKKAIRVGIGTAVVAAVAVVAIALIV